MDASILQIITNSFAELAAVVKDVLLVSVPAIIGIVCLSSGTHFALRKVRGLLSWA